jgi:tetratricopeptide (TPR) repeat protein
MIISPRKLATGYPWLDTLTHEFTHLIITRISNNHAPIWLHEGIAKLLEPRWREETFGTLTPEEAYLLDRASREGRLIPLRGFHPSVAYLPNQEDAALAYAQVLSFMHYLNGKLEGGWIRRFLEYLGNGMKIDDAVWTLSKFSLHRLYGWWKQSVSGRRQTPIPAVELMKRRFKHGKATGESGLESLLNADVRKHLRVGDLLRLRGHIQAAVKEYQRAHKLAQSPSPKVSDRLAACYLDLGNTKAVIAMLPKMAGLYPAHFTTFMQLGTALAIEDRHEEAAKTLEKANAINPFHPDVHCMLRDLYTKEGRAADADREAGHCRILAAHSDKASETKR